MSFKNLIQTEEKTHESKNKNPIFSVQLCEHMAIAVAVSIPVSTAALGVLTDMVAVQIQ